MTNVIAFPSKVFREWGPIAQALDRYLASLGATTYEAGEIIDRLQVKWTRHGVPLTCPVLRTIPGSPPSQPMHANNAGIKYHVREMPRNSGGANARSLFEFAKLDYEQSKTR